MTERFAVPGLLAVALLIGSQVTAAQTAAAAPDNTKSNATDPSNRVTADQQSNDKGDIDLTRRIRQGVMSDKSLSMYGQNIKIVSAKGHVTLNGVVKTSAEKSLLEAKATEVAGAGMVSNELKIAPQK